VNISMTNETRSSGAKRKKKRGADVIHVAFGPGGGRIPAAVAAPVESPADVPSVRRGRAGRRRLQPARGREAPRRQRSAAEIARIVSAIVSPSGARAIAGRTRSKISSRFRATRELLAHKTQAARRREGHRRAPLDLAAGDASPARAPHRERRPARRRPHRRRRLRADDGAARHGLPGDVVRDDVRADPPPRDVDGQSGARPTISTRRRARSMRIRRRTTTPSRSTRARWRSIRRSRSRTPIWATSAFAAATSRAPSSSTKSARHRRRAARGALQPRLRECSSGASPTAPSATSSARPSAIPARATRTSTSRWRSSRRATRSARVRTGNATSSSSQRAPGPISPASTSSEARAYGRNAR